MPQPFPRPATTVVVLDDDRSTRQTICLVLTVSGYRAVALLADPDMLPQIRAAAPAAILIDVWDLHPGRGLCVVDRLQADPATRDIPVVALSVQADRSEHRARYRRRGCSAVLPKPFDLDELRATVADAVLAATGMPRAGGAVPAGHDSRKNAPGAPTRA